jgi:Putative zinc-finger
MRTPIDHAQCSELLADHVHGALDDDRRAAVDEHLSGCSDCSAERSALAALAGAEGAAMTAAERERLHSGVMAATHVQRAIVVAPRRGFGARLYPALAAAATLVGLIAGGVYLSTEGADDAPTEVALDEADQPTPRPQTEDSDLQESAPEASGAAKVGNRSSQFDAAQGQTLEAASLSGVFVTDAGELTTKSLRRLGHREEPFQTFRSLLVSDVPDVRPDLLSSVLDQTPDAYSNDVGSCAQQVFDADRTTVLTYGALGRYEKEDVLALGFVASPGDGRRLDQYQIWLWRQGDCSFPRQIFSGSIRPQ